MRRRDGCELWFAAARTPVRARLPKPAEIRAQPAGTGFVLVHGMKTLLRILPLAAAWTMLASPAHAQDFDQFDFGLRLQATQSRFSRFSDVAAVGNASAGGTWASSINPASMAWDPVANTSAQYSLVQFDNGTELQVPAI